jgi:chromosome segregation ATPase
MTRLNGTLTWLEEEARQTKAALTRLQSQQDQIIGFLRDYADQIRIIQDSIAALRSTTSQIGVMDDALKGAQGALSQVRDSLSDLSSATDRHRKGDLAEVERLRQILNEAWRRIEALRSDLDPLPGRIANVAETQKRLGDSIQSTNEAHDSLRSEVVALGQKLQISVEREKRVDDRFDDHQLQLDALVRRDETAIDQLKILTDRIVETEGRMADVLDEEEARRALEEQVHLLRVQINRVEKQASDLESKATEHGEQIEANHRFGKQVDDRRAALAERVEALAGTMDRYREELAELVADYESLEEQHRVRLIAELQQQVRDVRVRISKARGT